MKKYFSFKVFLIILIGGMSAWFLMERKIQYLLINIYGVDIHIGIMILLGLCVGLFTHLGFIKLFLNIVFYMAFVLLIAGVIYCISAISNSEYIGDFAMTVLLFPGIAYSYTMILPFLISLSIVKVIKNVEI